MDINTSIATEDLTMANRIGLLVEIAEGMTREAGGEPHDAIMALFSAASLIAMENDPRPAPRVRKDLHDVLDAAFRLTAIKPANSGGPIS